MKMRIIVFCLSLCGYTFSLFAEDKKALNKIYKNAELNLTFQDYETALQSFLILHSHVPDNANINYKIGFCYLQIPGKKIQSVAYLENGIHNVSKDYEEYSFEEINAPVFAHLYLGNAYLIANRFDDAIEQFEQFLVKAHPEDVENIEFTKKQMAAANYAKQVLIHPADIIYQKLEENINLSFINFNPVVSGNEETLVYTARIGDDNFIYHAIKEGSKWSEPRNINEELKIDGSYSSCSVSHNGDELYLYRDEIFTGNIYVSHLFEGKWTKAKKLNNPINSKYWETHASLSNDGEKLYFTSDRPEGYGGYDIYVSQRIEGDEWGPAENLGPIINSPYNEETPFLTTNDEKLFFSSQGHKNMGGYDVFASQMIKGKWDIPENLGNPVNTTDDNLFFFPFQNGDSAYYAIADNSGAGVLNICRVDLNPVDDVNTESPDVFIADQNVQDMEEKITHKKWGDTITGSGKNDEELTFVSNREQNAGNDPHSFQKKTYEWPEEGPEINGVLFAYNEADIPSEAITTLNHLVAVIPSSQRPLIEIEGYADNKGTESYNLWLSERRALNVAQYLIEKGIPTSNVIPVGYGEANPIAPNTTHGSKDNPEGRKYNRRVEFKVLTNNEILIQSKIELPEGTKNKTPRNNEEKKIPSSFPVQLCALKDK